MTSQSAEIHEVNIEVFISYGHITRYEEHCFQI